MTHVSGSHLSSCQVSSLPLGSLAFNLDLTLTQGYSASGKDYKTEFTWSVNFWGFQDEVSLLESVSLSLYYMTNTSMTGRLGRGVKTGRSFP